MTLLLRPVMKTKCSMPASRASSTTIWMTGLSTMVSISFGTALVAGRKRVPRPATGKTAFLMRRCIYGLLLIKPVLVSTRRPDAFLRQFGLNREDRGLFWRLIVKEKRHGGSGDRWGRLYRQ